MSLYTELNLSEVLRLIPSKEEFGEIDSRTLVNEASLVSLPGIKYLYKLLAFSPPLMDLKVFG